MTFAQLIDWLDANKGTGRWQEVAMSSGVPYNTVARIARRATVSPSVQLVEKIVQGIRATEKSPA